MTSAADPMAVRLLLLLLPFVAACGEQRLPQLELAGSSLGTTFKVAIVAPAESLDTADLEAEILATLSHIDRLASTWRSDSELSVFNQAETSDWLSVTAEFCSAIAATLEISQLTDGAFDITVGPLVNLWGFGPGGPVSEPPTDAAIAAALQNVGYDKLHADCDRGAVRKDVAALYVDLSGWAKGRAVDAVSTMLDASGVDNYLVEIGGELRVRGHNSEQRKWAVGIEAPSTSQRVPQAVIRVSDTSVATSGDYRNYFQHDGTSYSHTIDPRTGRPVTHDLAAVTVVHPENAFADAMATALLVMGPEAGPKLAEDLRIAAYFLVRQATEIEEILSSEFEGLTTS
jgi:thiamine biosynthesis lipoprotein